MKRKLLQLTIGSNLHVIVKNKPLIERGIKTDYHYHDGIIHDDILVTNLEQDEKDGIKYLCVNTHWVDGSWGKKERICLLKINQNELKNTSIETDTKIYFVNEEDRDALMREMALKEIKKFEQQIEDYRKARIRDIEEVRKNY